MAEDPLNNLPPEERIKRLKELQEKKRKELEELEKRKKEAEQRTHKEIKEAEELLVKSLDELAEEEERERKRAEKLGIEVRKREEAESRSLEEQLRHERLERSMKSEQEGRSYTPINQIVEDLHHLQYTDRWSNDDVNLYKQRKEELQHAQQYRNTLSDDIVDQLDTAKQVMNQLGYKTNTF